MAQVGRNLFIFLSIVAFGHTLEDVPADINTAEGYTADRFVAPNTVLSPRSIIRDDVNDYLVVSQKTSQIFVLFHNPDKTVNATVIVDGISGLSHGLAYSAGYLYASNASQVLRWGYSPGSRSPVSGAPEVVVQGIPEGGAYTTRSIIVNRYSELFVSVGTAKEAQESETRAQIRKFNLAEGFPEGGHKYENGEKFATGVRNTVGLAIDLNNTLWGVDCGADDLKRPDIGSYIGKTNPGNKLIKFEEPGTFYGYPYCWTVDRLFGYDKGLQFAWPTFMEDKIHTDAWCQNTQNNHPPTQVLPAHDAPLGIIFYDGEGCDSNTGSFPCSMTGDLFVAFHGSAKQQPASGYKVVHVNSKGELEDIIFQVDTSKCEADESKCFRPVGLAFCKHGHLMITSDSTNEIIRVSHKKSEESKIIIILKKSLHIPGVIGLAIIGIITTCMVIMLVRRYCCRRTEEEVPYMREAI